MNRSHYVHLKNKYPNGNVIPSSDGIDVFDKETGEHLLALRRDGSGSDVDVSADLDLPHRFCLAPIPKDARVHKMNRDNSIGLDDKSDERLEKRAQFICPVNGYVKSTADLKKDGWEFDDKGRTVVQGSAPSEEEAEEETEEVPVPKKKKKKK